MTEPTPSPRPPPAGMGPHPLVAVRLCVVDCDLVVAGVAAMVRDARGIEVVDARDASPTASVDVAQVDLGGRPDGEGVTSLARDLPARAVVAFSYDDGPGALAAARVARAAGFLSKRATADELVDLVRSVALRGSAAFVTARRRTPEASTGLSDRECEVLALLVQASTTSEIAEALFLSENTVKTHTGSLYRKLGVANRTEAALWGLEHGFRRLDGAGEGRMTV